MKKELKCNTLHELLCEIEAIEAINKCPRKFLLTSKENKDFITEFYKKFYKNIEGYSIHKRYIIESLMIRGFEVITPEQIYIL